MLFAWSNEETVIQFHYSKFGKNMFHEDYYKLWLMGVGWCCVDNVIVSAAGSDWTVS